MIVAQTRPDSDDSCVVIETENSYLIRPQLLSELDLSDSEIHDLKYLPVESIFDNNTLLRKNSFTNSSSTESFYICITSKSCQISSLLQLQYENNKFVELQNVAQNNGFVTNMHTLAVYRVKQSEYFLQLTPTRLFLISLSSMSVIYEYSWKELITNFIQKNPALIQSISSPEFLTRLTEISSCQYFPSTSSSSSVGNSNNNNSRLFLRTKNYLLIFSFDLAQIMKKDLFFQKLEIKEFEEEICFFTSSFHETKHLLAVTLWESLSVPIVYLQLQLQNIDSDKLSLALPLRPILQTQTKLQEFQSKDKVNTVHSLEVIPLHSFKYYQKISFLNYFLVSIANGDRLYFNEVLIQKEPTVMLATTVPQEYLLPCTIDEIHLISTHDDLSPPCLSFLLVSRSLNQWYLVHFHLIDQSINPFEKFESYDGKSTFFKVASFQRIQILSGFPKSMRNLFSSFDVKNFSPIIFNHSHRKLNSIKHLYWLQQISTTPASSPSSSKNEMQTKYLQLFQLQGYATKYRLFSFSMENLFPVQTKKNTTSYSTSEMVLYRPIVQKNLFLAKKIVSSLYFPKKSILLLLVSQEQSEEQENSLNADYTLLFLESRKDENSFHLLDSFPCNESICNSFTSKFTERTYSIELISGPSHPFFFQSNDHLPNSDYPTDRLSQLGDGADALYFHLMIVTDDFTQNEIDETKSKKLFHFMSFRYTRHNHLVSGSVGKKSNQVQWISYFHYQFDDFISFQQQQEEENFIYPLEVITPCIQLRDFFRYTQKELIWAF